MHGAQITMATSSTISSHKNLPMDSDSQNRPRPTHLRKVSTTPNGAIRGSMPRSASTPNMHTLAVAEDISHERISAAPNVALEQIDIEASRNLVRFFRNTGPPSLRSSIDSQRNCFGSPTPVDGRRWSIQSLRKNMKTKMRPVSVQTQSGNNTFLSTTTAGHSYIAISVPGLDDLKDNAFMASPVEPSDPGGPQESSDVRIIKHGWPLRQSKPVRNSDVQVGSVVRTLPSKEKQRPSSPKSHKLDDVTLASLEISGPVLRYLNSNSPVEDHAVNLVPVRAGHSKLGSDTTAANDPAATKIAEPGKRASKKAETTLATSEQVSTQASAGQPSHIDSDSLAQSRPAFSGKQSGHSTASLPARDSPRPSHKQRDVSHLRVTSGLQVPYAPQFPQSPGFPALLATMTFPSPPDYSPSHSAKNSVSSSSPSQAPGSPLMAGLPSSRLKTQSSLDGRMAQQTRPSVKKYHSDGRVPASHRSERVTTTAARSQDVSSSKTTPAPTSPSGPGVPEQEANAKQSTTGSADDYEKTVQTSSEGQPPSAPASTGTERHSVGSTADTYQSGAITDSRHYSIASDTTATIGDGDTEGTDDQGSKSRRESYNSMTILEKKRSRWSLMESDSASLHRNQSMEDRSQTPTQSETSEAHTVLSEVTQSLAQRRRVRRAQVREKVHKDLNASMLQQLRVSNRPGFKPTDAVDSPVLGWFAQNASSAATSQERMTLQVSSPLTRSTLDSSQTPPLGRGSMAMQDSLDDQGQAAEHPNSSAAVISEASMKSTGLGPSDETQPESSDQLAASAASAALPVLSLSPVTVVVSIEGVSTPSRLRHLSLVNHSPSMNFNGISQRSEHRPIARQRPIPIRIAKPLDGSSAKASSRTNRKSVPNMPSPSILPKGTSTSRRMSMPSNDHPVDPEQSPTNHPSHRPSLMSKEQETQWLRTHQQETAHEWRLAALKERIRIERLVMEKDSPEENKHVAHNTEDDPRAAAETDGDRNRQLREKNSNSSIGSITATKSNRMDALSILNTNAAHNKRSLDSVSFSLGNEGDFGAATGHAKGPDRLSTMGLSVERRLQRLERNSDNWVGVVLPLLAEMNRTLREMQRESMGQDAALKLVNFDTTL